MKKGKSFTPGGSIPPDGKHYTIDVPIRNAPVPASAVIAMHQHAGEPARCTVGPGQAVREGMRIGEASGDDSADVHASIPGLVRRIGPVFLPSGKAGTAATIDLEGSFDHSGKGGAAGAWRELPPAELARRIRANGVVGLDRAALAAGRETALFVLNGVEGEPYLTADHRLLVEKTDEVLQGAAIVRSLLRPARSLAAVASDRPEAAGRLAARAAALELDLEMVPVRPCYPQGEEWLLLRSLAGREAAPGAPAPGATSGGGALQAAAGAVVCSAATLFAVYEAAALDKPLIERVVTVSGGSIRRPANLKVRLGTPVRELIEECGGFISPPARLVAGGPMTGFALMDLDAPVTKATAGVIALSRAEAPRGAQTPCIGCGRCVRACPRRLRPTVLYKWVDHGEYERAEAEGLLECTECGCCAYDCPARLPLVQGMRLGRAMLQRKAVG